MSHPSPVQLNLVGVVQSAYNKNKFMNSVRTETNSTLDYKVSINLAFQDIMYKAQSLYCRHNRLVGYFEEFKLSSCFRANILLRFTEELHPSLRDNLNLFCDAFEALLEADPFNVYEASPYCEASDESEASTDSASDAPDDPSSPMLAEIHDKIHKVERILSEIMDTIWCLYDIVEEVSIRPKPPSHIPLEASTLAESLNTYPWLILTGSISGMAHVFEVSFDAIKDSIFDVWPGSESNLSSLDGLSDLKWEDGDEITLIKQLRIVGIHIDDLIETFSKSDVHYFSQICQKSATRIGRCCLPHIYNRVKKDSKSIDQKESFGLHSSRLQSFILILKLTRLFCTKLSKHYKSDLRIVSKFTISQYSDITFGLDAMDDVLKEFVESEGWLEVEVDPDDSPMEMRTRLLWTMKTINKPLEVLLHSLNSSTIVSSREDLIAKRKAQDWCLMWAGQLDQAIKSFCIAFKEKLG